MRDESLWELVPSFKSYNWGKVGKESYVYRYVEHISRYEKTIIDCNGNLAELWVGTHLSGLNAVRRGTSGELLPIDEFLQSVNGHIPFLFKVLSIGEPLSIQVHPGDTEAMKLHAVDTLKYPDANAKPEFVIALTSMLVLHDFRQLSDIDLCCENIPEFRFIWNGLYAATNNLEHSKSECRLLQGVRRILLAPSWVHGTLASTLYGRISSKISNSQSTLPEEKLFHELFSKHRSDSGLWFLFVLNIKCLEPLDCLLITPGTVHAYISGDCLEAMRSSDNVVRAGLTHKHKDIKSFLRILEEKGSKYCPSYIFKARNSDSTLLEYIPLPIKTYFDFRVVLLRLNLAQELSIRIHNPHAGSVYGVMVAHGGCIQCIQDKLQSCKLSKGRLILFRAECDSNLRFVSLSGSSFVSICMPNTVLVLY